jgi:hypothetical protein
MKCAECPKERKVRKWCLVCYNRLRRHNAIYVRPRRVSIVRKPKLTVDRKIGRPRKRDERFISFLVSVIVCGG